MSNLTSATTPVCSALLTDWEICDRAMHLLAQNPYRAMRYIACDVRDGALILSGRVPSYHLKQMAQAALAELCVVARIENRIEVSKRAHSWNS